MDSICHSALGIDPSVQVVGSSIANGRLLLRAKTTEGKTRRYVACYAPEGYFKYFRRVSSSERKRLGRGENITHPLEKLEWSQGSTCWLSQWEDLKIITLTPFNLLAPTDYTTYVVNGSMITNQKLMEIINSDENHFIH